ncbi:hypothetical protein R2A130_2162 [Ahrensia sp. R2A130]|nr:hypothetical protein R2A130_2162 [Ahrensia sp. R2A130]
MFALAICPLTLSGFALRCAGAAQLWPGGSSPPYDCSAICD